MEKIKDLLHQFAVNYDVSSKETRNRDIDRVFAHIHEIYDGCVPEKEEVFCYCSEHKGVDSDCDFEKNIGYNQAIDLIKQNMEKVKGD